MIRLQAMVVAVGVLCLQGCVTTYVPARDEAMATVRVVGFGRPQLCKDGKFYWTPEAPGSKDGVSIPAGQRITVGAHLASAGYQVNYYCRPFLSFVPEAGRTYIMNSALSGEGRCGVELVREEATKTLGVAVEPTIGASNCFSR